MSERSGILLACDTLPENPWARDRLPAIREALAGIDHEVIDIYDFGTGEAAAHALHRSKARGFFTGDKLIELNERFRERVLASGRRVIVLGTVDNFVQYLFPETVRAWQAAGCFVVGILGDDEFNFERNWPYTQLFDRTVAYVKRMVDRYDHLRPGRCDYLPNSCHFATTDFEALQVAEAEKEHDVALFGSVFPARRPLAEALVAAGVPVSLFGGMGWSRIPSLAGSYRGFLPSEDFDATVRRSRIVLASMEDHLTGALHMNTKVWEAVRNGQMCLATRHPALAEDYGLVEGEHIATYANPTELVEKARRYLADPAERMRLARNLFEHVRLNFSYARWYRKLFEQWLRQAEDSEVPLTTKDLLPQVTLVGDEAGLTMPPGYVVRPRTDARSVETPFVLEAKGDFAYDPLLPALLAARPDVAAARGVGRLRVKGCVSLSSQLVLWRREAWLRSCSPGGLGRRMAGRIAAPPLFFLPLAKRRHEAAVPPRWWQRWARRWLSRRNLAVGGPIGLVE